MAEKAKYPRVVQRGPLKGQTVTSSSDHMKKLHARTNSSTEGLAGNLISRTFAARDLLVPFGVPEDVIVRAFQMVLGA